MTLSNIEKLNIKEKNNTSPNDGIFKETDDCIFYTNMENLIYDFVFIIDLQIQTFIIMKSKKKITKKLKFIEGKIKIYHTLINKVTIRQKLRIKIMRKINLILLDKIQIQFYKKN